MWRKPMYRAVTVLVLCVCVQSGWGETILSYSAGTAPASGIGETSPGVAFELDLTEMGLEPGLVQDVAMVTWQFEAGPQAFDELHVQIGEGEEYVFPPATNGQQVLFTYYDTAYIDPESIQYGTKAPLDAVWEAEVADGILTGNAWVQSDEWDWEGSTWWHAGTTIHYVVVPEPASLAVFAACGAMLLRPRRRGQARRPRA